ncbi:MAG: sugar phosphate isomerase/epimerase [Oscillospiraceae bacterium]|nr:sugar phosphate isomerase/epimerase [Oscillospiraceae bacterium]
MHPPAWDVNAAAPIGALREAAMWMNRKGAELCHAVGGTQVVFHPGYYDSESNFSRSRAQEHCYRALEDLVSVCKPLGLTVAFENIAGPAMALFTQEEYIHALDGIDPCVKFLLDVGHAHCNRWDIPAVIDAIAPRLCGFHLHDNDGSGDAHLPIGKGTIAWEPVFAAMRKLPDDVLYVLEYAANTPLSALEEGRDLLLREVEGKR